MPYQPVASTSLFSENITANCTVDWMTASTNSTSAVQKSQEYIHRVFKKSSHILYFKYLVKTASISIIFGVQYPQEISHQKIINSPTSPE